MVSSNIQWYPGHMEKARREMQDHLNAVDMIIEVRDARIPASSANPILDQMAQGKGRLILLNKEDLADEAWSKRWVESLNDEKTIAMAVNLSQDSNARKAIIDACRRLGEEKRQRMIRKGIRPRALRAMAVGVPNAGKSTLINRIAKRRSAKTEDRPGVTRSLTWIHADDSLDILDTPGVLWPKFSDQRTGSLLAATGAINEDILNLEDVAMDTIHVIRAYYPGVLEEEYHCQPEIRTDDMLRHIAVEKHLLLENGEPDTKRAASSFLHAFRKARLGRFTLERPYDKESKDL